MSVISSEILPLMPPAEVDGGAAVRGRQHVVAEPQQHLLDQLPLLVVVFDQQDRLACRRAMSSLGGAGASAACARPRQRDREDRALADLALDLDVAPRLLDDAVGGGEPEAGALPHLLGREERLEDAVRARSGGMPVPLSVTITNTVESSPAVRMISRPPTGIASRALTARFISTCSSCDRSPNTGSGVGRRLDDQLDVLADQPPNQHGRPRGRRR